MISLATPGGVKLGDVHLADHFLGPVSEQLFGCPVEDEDIAVQPFAIVHEQSFGHSGGFIGGRIVGAAECHAPMGFEPVILAFCCEY